MNLLKEVPGSVLWLMKLNDAAYIKVLNSAREQGVNPERIIFASRLIRVEDHLARYRLADLFLDTFPYNGHTTVGDALIAGIPVISIRGDSFASRVASSLLHDVDMQDLLCFDLKDYYEKALQLAKDELTLSNQRAKLLQRTFTSSWPPLPLVQATALKNILINI
jgi:predicted O-linked N-acetylglucosamine transferase (SPINDLY family)